MGQGAPGASCPTQEGVLPPGMGQEAPLEQYF